MYINPEKDIGPLLLDVEKPARYCGGEHGRLAKKDAAFQALIAFPDLYEIGMSNQAFRIIYNGLNRLPGISCDRAFAPAPDFEQMLRSKSLPLYGLDTGISLQSLDLLLFTLGYELGISGILAMLDVSGIPLHSADRGENFPAVIAGGPAVSNPLPYSAFIDAFWIGEAEAGFFELAAALKEIKDNGGNKSAMLERLREHPNIWMKGKEKAFRAVDANFGKHDGDPAVFPVASMKTVQHHGALEIMRGCPNGCRFCHAGYWYRPMRQKSHETIVRETEAFVSLGGYREISLSSLSSGDFCGIGELVDSLNEGFSPRHVSFQLPSLKVSTFALSLLEKISQTRKSGLTFAVETPLDFWQLAINKRVTEDSIMEILREAKRNGWRGAKFYFMIGLPLPQPGVEGECVIHEEEEIVNFIGTIGKKAAMHFNVNVGIFIPKPHTPYQWAEQIDSETAAAKLDYIRFRLRKLGHKVSVADTLISKIEGLISRGDERAGMMIEDAFHAGSRLDAWQEYIDKNAWQEILEKNSALAGDFLSAKPLASALPWQPVHSGVSVPCLRKELEKSNRGELTAPCGAECGKQGTDRCGVCNNNCNIVCNHQTDNIPPLAPLPDPLTPDSRSPTPASLTSDPPSPIPDPPIYKLIFSFTKEGSAVFHGHLDLVEIFSMAMCRAGLDVVYTQGFNPLAKLEIVAPLSLGISAGAEIAAVEFLNESDPEEFVIKMNNALPGGIRVTRAESYLVPSGGKKYSLASLLWGFGYAGHDGNLAYVPAKEEKNYRQQLLGSGITKFSLRRECVLAKNMTVSGTGPQWASYFDTYGQVTRH